MADQEQTQNTSSEEVTRSPIEERALSLGWRPQEEFDGDPADFRSAEVFVALQPFYEQISRLSKENKKLVQTSQHIAQTFTRVEEQAYQKALKELKDHRKTALQDGDIDRVTLLEDQIDNVKEQQRLSKETQQEQQQEAAPVNPEFVDWTSRNSWYENNRAMRAWADARGIELAETGMAPRHVLAAVEKEVKEEFPNKFTNPNRTKASAVEAGDGNRTSPRDSFQLSADEERIVNTIVQSGIMTRKEYIEQLKKLK